MSGKRVSLSKKHLETQAGAELLEICKAIKSDGRLSKSEIVSLAKWLAANKHCGLPAVDFLFEVVERIVADRRVTVEEMADLHQAIEKVLPVDVRKAAIERRRAIENTAKQRKKELQRAEREAAKQTERLRREEEREHRRQELPKRQQGFHSKIAGVAQRNDDGTDRQKIVRDHVRPGMTLINKRELNNRYDKFAISLWVRTRTLGIFETERQIGYLNSSVAFELAPYLDNGGWARITVKDVTGGGSRNYGVNIFIEDGRDVW